MSKEKIASYISSVLDSPSLQIVEDLASESHETRRFPDPYIFKIEERGLIIPSGMLVEDFMEKDSCLGRIEYKALQRIQDWANENESGVSIWFSPPYKKRYPVSKIIISEILKSSSGVKVLFNRAVVIDIDADCLLNLANQLSSDLQYSCSETLRGIPSFPDSQQFTEWFINLSSITSQINMINSGKDVLLKQETYATISEIRKTVSIAGEDVYYAQLHEQVRKSGLIGKHLSSCPTIQNTPFESVFKNSLIISESKTLECTCPFCNMKVKAIIKEGKIHCPKCKRSTTYNC